MACESAGAELAYMAVVPEPFIVVNPTREEGLAKPLTVPVVKQVAHVTGLPEIPFPLSGELVETEVSLLLNVVQSADDK